MALPNPIYIDQNALHPPAVIRGLAYGITTGAEGVWGNADLRVTQLGAAGNRVQVLPGGYSVRAKHLGGSYEAYSGKIDVAEQSPIISNVPSGMTWRYDLVILRVENPYVSGSGSWPVPADAVNGPYAHIVVVENVAADCWHVSQYNDTWEAITLARIRRPANSTIVTQEHITDLRSLAALGGTRTIVEQVDLPPIAQEVFAVSTHCNNNHELKVNNTAWIDWPSQAVWQVPVPDWARKVAVMMVGTPASRSSAWGEIRLNFNGAAFSPREFDINNASDGVINVYRANIPYGGVYTVPEGARGKIATVKVQAHSMSGSSSERMLIADGPDSDGAAGCYFDTWLLFQRQPDAA